MSSEDFYVQRLEAQGSWESVISTARLERVMMYYFSLCDRHPRELYRVAYARDGGRPTVLVPARRDESEYLY